MFLIKIVVFILGLICIYIALFLYEDEEGKIQDKLQEIWLKSSYAKEKRIPKVVNAFKEAIIFLHKELDEIIGQKLFSFRVFKISISLSLFSMIFFSILFKESTQFVDWASSRIPISWQSLVFAFSFMTIGIIKFTIDSFENKTEKIINPISHIISNYLFWSIFGSFLVSPILAIAIGIPISYSLLPLLIVVTIFLFAFLFDILAIAYIRYIRPKPENNFSIFKFIVFILINIILLFIAIVPFFLINYISQATEISDSSRSFSLGYFEFLLLSNFPSILMVLFTFMTLLFVLGNNFFFQIIPRVIYPLQKYHVIYQKRYLLILAFFLISFALGITDKFFSLIGFDL